MNDRTRCQGRERNQVQLRPTACGLSGRTDRCMDMRAYMQVAGGRVFFANKISRYPPPQACERAAYAIVICWVQYAIGAYIQRMNMHCKSNLPQHH